MMLRCLITALACLLVATPAIAHENLAEWLTAAASYETGKDSGPLKSVEEAIVEASKDPAQRATAEKLLIEALGKSPSREGISFLCRQLVIVGSEASIPALEGLLADANGSHMARYVLGRLESDEAAKALVRGLGHTDGTIRIGIVNTLGDLRYEPAVDELVELLGDPDADTACAAARGLGRIGGTKAVTALNRGRIRVPSKIQRAIDSALLQAAECTPEEAVKIYTAFYRPDNPLHLRLAGLRGLINHGEGATDTLIKALQDEDLKMRRRVIAMMASAQGEQATKTFVKLLPTLLEESQVLMLSMLATRGDAAASPAVVDRLTSEQETIRLAALDALSELGDASAASVLARHAARNTGTERDRARSSLDRLGATETDQALSALLKEKDPQIRIEAIRSLASRGATDQAAAVLKAAGDEHADVRKEATRSLRTLAGEAEVNGLFALLLQAQDDGWRGEVESTLSTTVQRMENKAAMAQAASKALSKADSGNAKAATLRVLGKTGHPIALAPLLLGSSDSDEAVKDASIRALAAWEDGKPADRLRAMALDESNSNTHRVIAMRGYIEKISLSEEVNDQAIMQRYREAIDKAWRNEEKQLVLSKLSDIRHPDALTLIQAAKANPALKGSAEAAEKKVKKLLTMQGRVSASHNAGAAKNAIDGNQGSRWDTGGSMRGGEWFSIDLGFPNQITGLTIDCRGSDGDYARGYEIYVSPNTISRGTKAATGEGASAVIEVKFDKPVSGRNVTILQTGSAGGLYWSIHELTVHSE